MSEQFMRIGGRGTDGLAKPIATTNNGIVRTSEINATKRFRHMTLQPGETVEVVNTDKEVILQSLYVKTAEDSLSKDSFTIGFGISGDSLYTVPYYEGSTFTHFITPSGCIYDNVFETVVNETGNRIIHLKKEIRTKGLAIKLVNRDNQNSFPTTIYGIYSEVE